MALDPPRAEPMRRGDAIGRYLVLESLGAGGIGTVYRAHDPDLDRAVALKRVRPELGDSEARRARVLREAQAMARLTHPNVVAVYDVLDDDRGVFIAMELVQGEDLDRWLDRPRPLNAILDVFVDCAAGLAAAHRANVCHRDCKPSNFLVTPEGVSKVADFGLAAPAVMSGVERVEYRDRMVVQGRLSADGAVPGTVGYTAPEVLAGAAADPKSDQFSFCVALQEAVQRGRPQVPVPRAIRRVLRRGLDPDPQLRFPDMEAVGAALTAARDRPVAIATRVAIVAGVVMAATAVAVASTSDAQCPNDQTRWTGIWDTATRRNVEAAVASADLPNAAAVSANVVATLDDYTVRWSEGYGLSCARTSVSGAQYHARSLCYELRREQVRALVGLVESPDPSMAAALSEPTHALEPLEPCATAEPQRGPTSGDRHTRRELDAALADVAALRWAGQLEAARDRAREVVARADEHEDALLRSAAQFELGLTQMEASDYEPAIESLAAAYWLAETLGDARKAAAAAVAIVTVLGSYLEQPTRADAWVPRAKAAVAALDVPGREGFSLDNALGSSAHRQGDYPTALAHYEHALASAASSRQISAAKTAIVLQNLASTLEKMGRWQDAQARYDAARVALEREHGSTHPSLGLLWHNVAIFNHARGHREAALAAARRALQVKEATLPSEHFSIAITLHALGTILQDNGEGDEAEAVLVRAKAILSATVGHDHPVMGALLVNLADLAMERGDLVFAERRFDEAIVALERTYDSTHELVLQAKAHRAGLWSAQGRSADALAELTRVRDAIAETQGGHAVALQNVDLEIANVLREQGKCDEANEAFARVLNHGQGGLPDEHDVLVAAREGLSACAATLTKP